MEYICKTTRPLYMFRGRKGERRFGRSTAIVHSLTATSLLPVPSRARRRGIASPAAAIIETNPGRPAFPNSVCSNYFSHCPCCLRSWRRAAATTTRQTPRRCKHRTAHPRIWRRRSRPSCSNRRKCPPDRRREALPTRPMNNWQAPRRRNRPGSNRSDACCPVRSRSCRPRTRARGPRLGGIQNSAGVYETPAGAGETFTMNSQAALTSDWAATYSDFSDVRWGEIDRVHCDESTWIRITGFERVHRRNPNAGAWRAHPGSRTHVRHCTASYHRPGRSPC